MKQDVKPIFLNCAQVARFVSLSEGSVHKLVRENKFPKPRMISEHRSAWLIAEVEAWAKARPISDITSPHNGGAHPKAIGPTRVERRKAT
jgi:prophage regulatory protein